MQRRDFLGAAGAGLVILKSGTLRGQNRPSNKLNIALIGVWGRGTAHYNVLKNENVVALCDVNDNRTKEALAIFPKAKTYWDWRRLLGYMDLHWEVLLVHLLNFRWAYPSERENVPRWLMDELIVRLKQQLDLPSSRWKICRGRIFSERD